MAEFERLVLTGTPRERGIEHGERFAEEVAANVETYRERFAHEGVDIDALREQAAEYVEYVERESPDYAAEMRGIAEGSGVDLVDVTMLNVRWEVIYPAWKAQTEKANEPPRRARPPPGSRASPAGRASPTRRSTAVPASG
ncbi:hypothetical protein [Halorubrum aethiopicum]|uniref:hypothetical protein n=1 Tax=Halorubrum aethiopicum TaxID=1758255 RepID=UPI00083503C9|nr:hypothetical protein [Halorubrum aethiopicum]